MKKKFSHSVRKYIAHQKSLIRRKFLDVAKQEEAIAALYAGLSPVPAPAATPVKAK